MLQRENSESRGGILGDDMGLGKTPQSIGLMMLNQPKEDDERKSTLILVPRGMALLTRESALCFITKSYDLQASFNNGRTKLNITAADG